MTSFSPFDKRLLEEGLAYFDRPRLTSLLELLGTSRFERVQTLVTMLQHSSPEEYDEAVAIFERATARADRERDSDEGPHRERYSRSAERRAQRRRSS
jgi:hypothetical protein